METIKDVAKNNPNGYRRKITIENIDEAGKPLKSRPKVELEIEIASMPRSSQDAGASEIPESRDTLFSISNFIRIN